MVLLHPGVGLDGSVFLPGARRLAATHKLYLVDLPGNGHSPDGNRDDWNLAGFAATLAWYLANEAWWRAVLDGSYRTWVETNYAAR